MPGSNEYSMSPDLRTNTSDSKPTLVSKSNPTPKVTAPKQPTKSEWKATNATGMVAGDQTYKVKAGNTLGQIVAAYNKLNGTKLTWQDVAKWNGVDEKKLKIGQVLKFKPDESTSQTTPAPASTEVKSNTTTTPVVETETPATPATDKAESDSTQRNSSLVLPVDTGNVVVADSASRDSSLVLPVDTGYVARTDSALLSSPNAASVSSITPVITTRSPRNFNWTGYYFNYPTEELMREIQQYRDYLRSLDLTKVVSSNKQGGTMNRIKYFQQGGAAPSAQQGQADAFMQAILQGDPQAIAQLVEAANGGNSEAQQLIQTILNEEEKRNPKVAKAAQVIKQILGQATSAKWGSKLQYIRSLKYAKGGKTCPTCQAAAKGAEVEMKKCGGKKAKKRYFGGYL